MVSFLVFLFVLRVSKENLPSDAKKGEDVLSEERAVEAAVEEQEEQSISVAQGYNSQSIAVAIPADESVDDYDGQAKVDVDVNAGPTRDYLPPSNEYLPPAVFNEVANEESVSQTKTEDVLEEAIDDEISAVVDDVIPVAIAESKITESSSAEEETVPEVKVVENNPAPVYGVPKVEDVREPKQIAEETPVDEAIEVKTVEEEVKIDDEVKTVIDEAPEEDTKTAVENEEVPVDDAKTVADDSILVVEEPTPVVQEIPEPVPVIPVVPVVPVPVAPTKRARIFPAKRPSFVPQRKKVLVQLEEEDEEAIEYVPVRNRQVVKPKKEVVEVEEEQPFPLGGTFFPINFGGTSGGAIAIANSFSTSKGGSSKSQAVAYGSGSEQFRARKPVKSTQPDCDC